MARDTVSTVVERIRRQLASTVRMEINVLGASLTASETTVTFAHELENSLRSGAVLSMGSELMRVISVNTSAKEATVLRGWQDSTAEAHDTGDEVLVNPRFTRYDIFDAIVQEIDSWDPDLFTVDYVEATVTDTTETYELPVAHATALGVISVQINTTERESTSWPDQAFTLQRGPTTWTGTPTEASGLLIRFTSGIGFTRAGTILVEIAKPYETESITETTDLSSLGMQRPLLELLEMGVKMRLLADDEIPRSSRGAQDEPRRSDEVPPGSSASTSQLFARRHEQRRAREVRRLRTRYPMRAW